LQNNFRENVENEKIEVGNSFFQDIETYIHLIKKWNKVHNLTRMNESEIYHSIFDSIIPLKFVEFQTLLDIGSGAGFPAIPIALACRDKTIILVEPLKKKSSFLHYLKTSLNLTNIKIYSDRVENLNIPKVDLVTSRAVTNTETLINLAQPFAKSGGKLLFYKGSNLPTEIQNITLNYRIEKRENRNYLLIDT